MDVPVYSSNSNNSANCNSKPNGDNSNNSSSWGHHYHRYSSVSLASAANSESEFSVAESFHTCYEPSPEDQDPISTPTSIILMPSSRVQSFSCLEDVMEEEPDTISTSNNEFSSMPKDPHQHFNRDFQEKEDVLIPRRSFSQLQQQPLSPQLTAARLALSSDIGILRRSLMDVSSASSFQDKRIDYGSFQEEESNPSKLARVLLERDQRMVSAALPMSRSFATPRVAVGTAFRQGLSDTSITSLNSITKNAMDIDGDDISGETPSLVKEESVAMELEAKGDIVSATMFLDDLSDDIHLYMLSFLPLEGVRAFMATNRRFRKLLFTEDAQNIWKNWFALHQWPQIIAGGECNNDALLVDDLCLPTAARPNINTAAPSPLSKWHQQANLSLLLSMAQSQPTDIDKEQLHEYTTWSNSYLSRTSRRSRRIRHHRIHTTTQDGNHPLLHVKYAEHYQQEIVHFTGRVGQGDRCVRANQPLPRATLIPSEDATWIVSPSQAYRQYRESFGHYDNNMAEGGRRGHGFQHNHNHHSLMDLFCRRSVRHVVPTRPAWKPFVAPFVTNERAVHLTPRFVSYFEISILEPVGTARVATEDEDNNTTTNTSSSTNDCVAVGVATDSFDWHARMPGWDAASFGYHGDDGGIFHSSGGMLRKYGPSYGRGDVVGCGIDYVTRGIFFTLNGKFLGYAWSGLPSELLEKEFYPVVGIDTNDWIHHNYGTEPFMYNLKSMVVRHEDLVHQSLAASKV